METLHFSVSKNRYYKRKFDHDAARALREAGFTYETVGKMLGVSTQAIILVCDPGYAQRSAALSKSYYQAVCEMCGGPCLSVKHKAKWGREGFDGRQLCKRCRDDTKRLRLRFDELGALGAVKCATCKQWLHPERFGRGVRHKEVRDGGIHTSCRGCLTKLRQEYRERHKVPCERCGTPTLAYSEKIAGGRPATGFCLPCWHATRKKAVA